LHESHFKKTEKLFGPNKDVCNKIFFEKTGISVFLRAVVVGLSKAQRGDKSWQV